MMIRIFVVAALVNLSVLQVSSQDFTVTGESHHRIEKKDGFEKARCFIQDENGFFWVGTSEGLLRYSGHEVDKLDDLLIHKSPTPRDITALHLDSAGNIWIAGRGKIFRLVSSSMTIDEMRLVNAGSQISRLPDINDLNFVDDQRLLATTYQGLYILSPSDTGSTTWNVSHFNQLNPTPEEFSFLDSLQSRSSLVSSLIIRDSLLHSVAFTVKKSSELLIVSTSPKMFSGIGDINDMAWVENHAGERVWTKYDQFYFLSTHPTIVQLPAGKYTLYTHMRLYNYFIDTLPQHEVKIYDLDQESARHFRKMTQDWNNRRSVVEDNTGVMYSDKQGTVWITGGGGLTSLKFVRGKPMFNVFTPHEGKEFGQHGIHTFTIKPSRYNGFWLLGRGYSRVAQLRQGKAIFGQNHIMFYEADRGKFSRLAFEGIGLITDIAEDTDSSLWVLHENGILNRIMFHRGIQGGLQLVEKIDVSSFGRADKLLIDHSGNPWVLTEKQGLIKITLSKNQVFSWSWPYDRILFGKTDNVVDEFLLFTGDGSVLTSRIDKKILDASVVSTLKSPVIDFLRLSDTSAIAATRHGRIYFLNKHLRSEESIEIDTLYSNPRFPIQAIRLVSVSEDSVYLCTNHGLFTINVRKKEISSHRFAPQPQMVPTIWDVFSYKGKQLAVVNTYSRAKGNSGFIVPVETTARKKGSIDREYADLGTEINAVVQWSGRILVGSELGIHEYIPEKDTFLLFTPAGFPPVYNMIADDSQFIWTIGNKELSCYDAESGNFRTVVASLPLQEKNLNKTPAALWKNDMAHVLFALDNRLYKLVIDSALIHKNNPVVHFDNLVVQDQPGENRKVNLLHNKIVLGPRQGTFTINFAATDLTFPERAYFSYRLTGYHEDWINTTNSEIQFINVPPGDYTLELLVVDGPRKSFTSMELQLEPFWWQTITARSLFVVVLLLITWWAWNIRSRHLRLRRKLEEKHRENDKIAMMNQMRSRFFANISHEFRTPLTLISGPIEDRIKTEKDPGERKALGRVLDQTKRMMKLVNELLSLSKLESGRLPVETSAGDIMQYVNSIAESFNNVAAEKELKYLVTVQRKPLYVEFDPEQIAKVLVNLTANAIKFCPRGGKVSLVVGYDHQTRLFQFDVQNEGEPIPEGDLSMIFNPFYRAGNANAQGSGIGLTLVKELVENMNGTIDAFSDAVNGTRFCVSLPLPLATNSEFQTGDRPPKRRITTDALTLGDHHLERASYQLLIIEDDEEMRDYVSGIFTSAERPATAANGEIGFDMAVEIIPDLIICDVMMPGTDGIACCERLKNDPRTDHIPIILLTAKVDFTDRMEGLRAGADDYIIKPFSSEELRIKVKNLINQRHQLKKRFGSHIQSNYTDLPMKSSEERFLDKAISIVHEHIGNAEFDIMQFSSSMNLSRTHLHKKLKGITGQSPSEFMRNLRLQRAAQLLAAGTDQVSLIAYDTGFNNLSYFTRMFKAKYGLSPSEYKRQSIAKC